MKHIASFRPRFFEVFRGYSRQTFSADLMAGLVVGIVALPLAIAFGIASGVSPEKGIITAVVAGFVVSLLGGSRVQIGGPTGAFIVIVYGVVQQYGETGLLVATFMAGVLLVAMGLFKLGAVIRFIPYPVVVAGSPCRGISSASGCSISAISVRSTGRTWPWGCAAFC